MRERIDTSGMKYDERFRALEDIIYRQGERIEQLQEELVRLRKAKEG